MQITQEPDGVPADAPSSLHTPPQSSSPAHPGQQQVSHGTVLSVRGARCVVPADDGGTRTIFEGIDLDITGSITDITGPSGCGKSTLLTTIARLNPGGGATMSLDGTDSSTISPQQWRLQVAYVNQRPVLMGETIRETLLFPWTLAIRKDHGTKGRGKVHRHGRGDGSGSGRENQTDAVAGRGRVSDGRPDRDNDVPRPTDGQLREALDRAGLADISLDRPVHDVSGGQYARVALLRTLLTRPRVLLADEVDAALDDASDAQIEQLIAEAAQGGMAVVRVRHRASDGLENRLLRLENSRLTDITAVVGGTPQTIVPAQKARAAQTESSSTPNNAATAEGGAR